MKNIKPDYAFSPSLLDAFQRMTDTSVEDFFYQDEEGKWHTNWNETDGSLHFSEEEVDDLLKKEFIDTINKVEREPSEAASKGSVFNEIVDCMILKRKCTYEGMVIKTIKDIEDLYRVKHGYKDYINIESEDYQSCMKIYSSAGNKPFIYASLDGFEFYFDIDFCREARDYFQGSIAQYYTKCLLKTPSGVVELHGYIDYLKEMNVFDAKTTKHYTFGDYQKRWQRYTYPFSLIESGLMNEINSFEFTIYVLKGGTSRTPLITGTQYREVYTYSHEEARSMLIGQCEKLISFLEENKNMITNRKVFADYGIPN